MFKDKKLLITGGTGSFGNAVVRRFLDTDIGEIRIFSRDEKKQDDMRKHYANPKLKFFIGDVRDRNSIVDAIDGADFIFHAAALKQVPSCEFYPVEAVKTNVLGTANVLDLAAQHGVKRVVVLSTDKAAYPINAMGMSKALMEKIATAKARSIGDRGTIICRTRYGNVMASRGSVIPVFKEQMLNGYDVTVTDSRMTRFMMTLDDAVELVLYAFRNGQQGDLFVQKAPAATIQTLVDAMAEVLHVTPLVRPIGVRHGEKRYETLVTKEEMATAEDLGSYFRVPMDDRDLNYGFSGVELHNIYGHDEFNSDVARRLDVPEMKELLYKTGLFGGDVGE
mgnify:FL=1|jgi:UDP-glucose 4-epimerase